MWIRRAGLSAVAVTSFAAIAGAQGPVSTGGASAGSTDPNYQVSVNGGTFASAFVRSDGANFGGVPLIAPTASGSLPGGSPDGNLTRFSYSFRTTFMGATGFSFQCGVDDTFLSVLLNGAPVSGACAQYGLGSTVAVSGLAAGSNTLVFNTTGNGTTDGLAVRIVSVTPSSTVPEPGTWALLGTGLLALGGVTARRRRDTV